MYLNKLSDPLSCLFTFPKISCSLPILTLFSAVQSKIIKHAKKISAFTDTTIILFCWRRTYTEFFRNYPTLKAKVEIIRKHTAALDDRRLARGLTALQVVRTSFLGPRPRRFPPRHLERNIAPYPQQMSGILGPIEKYHSRDWRLQQLLKKIWKWEILRLTEKNEAL